jgi:flagellar motor protein MotB
MNENFLKMRLEQTRQKQLQSSNKPNSMPSNNQMIKNLGSSVIKNVVSVAQGNSLKINPTDANARLSICKQCPFFESNSQRCSKCGCYLSVKTYLKAERCPIGKW